MYMTLAAIRDMYKGVDNIFEAVHKHAYTDLISNMTLKEAAIKTEMWVYWGKGRYNSFVNFCMICTVKEQDIQIMVEQMVVSCNITVVWTYHW